MAAVRLACFVPAWESADWKALLSRGLERLSDFKKWRKSARKSSSSSRPEVEQ
jgi:hypothetical protein